MDCLPKVIWKIIIGLYGTTDAVTLSHSIVNSHETYLLTVNGSDYTVSHKKTM